MAKKYSNEFLYNREQLRSFVRKTGTCSTYGENLWLSSDESDQEEAYRICKSCAARLACSVLVEVSEPIYGTTADEPGIVSLESRQRAIADYLINPEDFIARQSAPTNQKKHK